MPAVIPKAVWDETLRDLDRDYAILVAEMIAKFKAMEQKPKDKGS